MTEKSQSKRGGKRPGAGRPKKKGEKKKPYLLSLHPSIVERFRKKHRRKWGERLENLIKEDLKQNY